MRTAYKWSGWEPPKPIVFVLLWLCDIYLTISLDYPWFLYKRVILVTHLMDEHSEVFCFITTAVWSVFVLSVWFKHSVLYSSEWRRSFVRILKPTGGYSGSCSMHVIHGLPHFEGLPCRGWRVRSTSRVLKGWNLSQLQRGCKCQDHFGTTKMVTLVVGQRHTRNML